MKPLHLEKKQITFFRRYDNLDFVPHLHNAVEIVLLLSGQSTALCDGKRYLLHSGDLFISFPWQVHGYENSHSCEAIVLEIPSAAQPATFRDILSRTIPTLPLLRKESRTHTHIDTLIQMGFEERSRTEPIMQGFVLLILGKLLPLLSLRDISDCAATPLQTILLYLNEHYTEPLTRTDIASAVGYSESYLSHLFSDLLHTTLSDYLLSLRLNDALRLLSGSEMTISQIAISLGFGTIRSFNRAFQKKMHTSPSAYRTRAESM